MSKIIICFSESLQFYRGSSYDITDELNHILQLNEEKALLQNNRTGCGSTLKRIFSSAFGIPFIKVGIIRTLHQWGESTTLMMNMIQIFRDSKSSVEPKFAPVFVGVVQVWSSIFSIIINLFATLKF